MVGNMAPDKYIAEVSSDSVNLGASIPTVTVSILYCYMTFLYQQARLGSWLEINDEIFFRTFTSIEYPWPPFNALVFLTTGLWGLIFSNLETSSSLKLRKVFHQLQPRAMASEKKIMLC